MAVGAQDEHLARCAQAVDRLTGETLRDLRRLTEINSFTWNRQGVDRNAALISELFVALGFAARRVPSVDPRHAAHLVLERAGRRAASVLLLSHLDTVYSPEEEADNDFHWREDGDRIYAPGIVDIKGGTILVYFALRVLAEQVPELFDTVGWTVMLNAAEETGSACFPGLLQRTVSGDTLACLVFEHGNPGEQGASTITVGRRGSARFRVDAHGRAAHSGSGHHRGASAVHALSLAVAAIEGKTDPSRQLTFNVGLFEGGSVVNTVPSSASCLVDLRADDPEVYAEGSAWIRSLAGESAVRARSDGYAASCEVTRLPGYPPWPENPASAQLASLVRDAGADLGQVIHGEYRLGASDGSHVWDRLPTIDGLGPLGGSIHCAVHDPASGRQQEHLLRSSLASRTMLTIATLLRLSEPRSREGR